MRGDLVGPTRLLGTNGSESLALGPESIRPAREQFLDLVRAGVSGQIKVRRARRIGLGLNQRISNRASDEVEPLLSSTEALPELFSRLDERSKARWVGRGRHGI